MLYTILSLRVLGSYDNLGNADMLEIFEDFTGGVAEVFNIEKDEDSQERLFRTLKEEVDNKSLMAAVIPVSYACVRAIIYYHSKVGYP